MLLACSVAASGAAFGATSFTDAFTGGASANWDNPAAADYTNNDAAFQGADGNNRTYLRTTAADYNTVDFVATIDLTRGNGSGGSGCSFFGIGNGEGTASAPPYWGEPTSGEAILIRLNTNGWSSRLGDIYQNYSATGFTDPNNAVAADTPLSIQMTYVAATGTATFVLDTDGNGFDGSDPTYSQSNTNLTPTTSRIFFGGSYGTTGGSVGDNFSVTIIPEPSSAALLALGGLALLRRRRG